MSIFLLVIVILLLGTNVYTVVQLNKLRKLPEYEAGTKGAIEKGGVKAIANPNHQIERTFVDRRITQTGKAGQDFLGWNFICSCGTIAPAVDNKGYEGSGSEAGAVQAWHNHIQLYTQLVDGPDNELEKVKKELEEHLASCICKDLK